MRCSIVLLSVMTAMATAEATHDLSSGFSRIDRRTFPGPKAVKSAKVIVNALSDVRTSVDGLDAAVLKVKGTDAVTALADVATKANGLGDEIKAAQAKIKSADETDIGGAVGIQDSAKSLGKSLDKLSDDLITIEPTVRKAGLDGTVVDILKQQQTSAGGLVGSVTEKLPKLAKGLAKEQTAGVTMSLTRVIDAYEKGAASAPKKDTATK